MRNPREEICCQAHHSQKRLHENISHYSSNKPFSCITEHPGFYFNCLVPEVLDENWKTYKQMYGKIAVEGSLNKRRRHTAYRNLFRFIFGFAKKQQRSVLPTCAVAKIRYAFPEDGTDMYTGFKKRKRID